MKSGALIALAAGSLFAAACKKEETGAGTPPATGTAKQPEKPDPGGTTADPSKPTPTAEKVAQVDCAGVNECKGQGTCKTEKHGCGGQNACKGQGVLKMAEADCTAKGGKITQRYE